MSDTVWFSGLRSVENAMLESHIVNEAVANLCTWYARVLTERIIADFPLRAEKHALLD